MVWQKSCHYNQPLASSFTISSMRQSYSKQSVVGTTRPSDKIHLLRWLGANHLASRSGDGELKHHIPAPLHHDDRYVERVAKDSTCPRWLTKGSWLDALQRKVIRFAS